jgi:hypothetical protein
MFRQYTEAWLTTYARLNCKPSTYTRYVGVERNHLLPVFATIPMPDITRDAVKCFLITKRDILPPSSVRQILAPLRKMLNHAMEDGLISSNPAARVSRVLAPLRGASREEYPLTRKELALFLTTISRRSQSEERQRPAGGELSQQLMEVCRHLLTQRKEDALRHGWPAIPSWVFCSQVGRLLDPAYVRSRVFYRVWRRQGYSMCGFTTCCTPTPHSCCSKGNRWPISATSWATVPFRSLWISMATWSQGATKR